MKFVLLVAFLNFITAAVLIHVYRTVMINTQTKQGGSEGQLDN